MEPRVQREKEFYNEAYTDARRAAVRKYYSIDRSSWAYYEKVLFSACAGRRVLEYGCGVGSYAFRLVPHGAQVVGIDISDVAIEQAGEQATLAGMSANPSFQVMNAEELHFDEDYFDVVCGISILHHLDLEKAVPELSRVLKPGGRAFFIEPLGYNVFINLYRHLTPALRTEDEHPLLNRDLNLIRRHFAGVKLTHFHLFTLLAVPFRKLNVFDPLLATFEKLDRVVLSLPGVRSQAWQVIIELSQPRKPDAGS